MNYIKTKDGIYEESYYREQLGISKNEEQFVGINKPINKADTIEELCDEFVFVSKNGNQLWCVEQPNGENVMIYTYLGLTKMPKKEILKDGTLYGAIWTDKGLIYVAKMKGVLPNGEVDWELL